MICRFDSVFKRQPIHELFGIDLIRSTIDDMRQSSSSQTNENVNSSSFEETNYQSNLPCQT